MSITFFASRIEKNIDRISPFVKKMEDGNSWKMSLICFFTNSVNHATEIAEQDHSNQSDRLFYFLKSLLKFEKWKIYQNFGGKLQQVGEYFL